MSYLGAAQSALFYFLACTPCTKIQNFHRTRQEAKKEREVKARIVMEQPHLYQHPEPFHTNPYWAEEIRMGPSLPKKRKGSDGFGKSLSQRRLTTGSRDGRPSIGTGSSVAVSLSEMGSTASAKSTTWPANSSRVGSSRTVVPEEDPASPALSKTASISTSGDWNTRRYEREDEELWGYESSWSGHRLMDAIKQAGTTAGRYMESKLGREKQVTDEDRYNFYFTPRNPPVNEYHPPVVSSKPMNKDALKWMLQPPPPAKVMDGRVPVSRSSSMVSAGSRRTVSTRDGGSLSRLVGEKALEAKLSKGETPFDGERRPGRSPTRTRSRLTTASSAAARTGSRRTTTTRANGSSTDSESESEEEYVPKSSETVSSSSLPNHAAQKPRVPTIASSGTNERGSSSAGADAGEQKHSHAPRELANPDPKPELTTQTMQPPLSSVNNGVAVRA